MNQKIDTRLLGNFEPLQKLSEQSLSELAANARLFAIKPNQKLRHVSTDKSLLYLLKGEVSLLESDIKITSVAATSKRARLPLYADDQAYESVQVEKDGYVIEIDRATLNRLIEAEFPHSSLEIIEVNNEVDLDSQQNELLLKLYAAYEEESLELPSMPEIALRLREATRDPDVTIDQLVRIIQADAAIAGSLLHAANGPLFCAAGPVKNLRNAVIRLGVATTQSLATAVGLFKVFHAQNPMLRKRINQAWHDSLAVSGLSYMVAKHVRGLDPDRALLAGLLHKVGTISVLGYLDAHGLKGSDKEIDAALEVLNRPVGILVMNYWDMGDDLIQVIEEYTEWNREPEHPDYCDVVQTSWLYHAISTQRSEALPALDDIPATKRLGLDIPAEQNFEGFSNEAYSMIDITAAV